jgi:hypothetical protein
METASTNLVDSFTTPIRLHSNFGMAIGLTVFNMVNDVTKKCGNCDAEIEADHAFCGVCGQKVDSKRLSLHAIGHDLLHVFVHVDRSALSLVRLLLVQPGHVAQNYVQGKRKRYFGPFAFLFVVVAAASAMTALTGFQAISSSNPNVVGDFLQRHINIVMFAEVPLLAAFSRLFDVRGGFNLAEHLVLAAYTSGMRVLFVIVIVIPVWYVFRHHTSTIRSLYYAYWPIWPLYFGFATAQFLAGKRALSWGKGILSAILTWASVQALASLVTSLYFRFFVAA